MAKKPPKLDSQGEPIIWTNIDPATLTGKAKADYAKLREAWALVADATKDVRASINGLLPAVPAGKERRISFQFGSIGIAVCAPDGPKASGSRMSLVEYNKQHAA